MTKFSSARDFAHGKPTKVGILVCNLGTPDAPTPRAVRRYLAEFLADSRVVEIPRVIWLAILHGIVLRVRPKRSAAAYAKVWQADGSPLLAISKRQGAAVAAALEATYPARTELVVAMRYGSPSIVAGLRRLREANIRKLLIVPLYPQYAAATAGSVMDAVSRELRNWRWVPSLRFVSDYHDDAGYIAALGASLDAYWSAHGRGEHLIMSFHGTPKRTLLAGDPYHCQCHATARRLAEWLGLGESDWTVSFQSRFGRAEWLQPYTETLLKEKAAQGVRTVDVICPGFTADCLETLEEIALQYAATFRDAGGGSLRYVPALNDNPEHIDALVKIVMKNLAGWDEFDPDWDLTADEQARIAAAERARILRTGGSA